MTSPQKDIQLIILEFLKALFLVLQFSCYTLMTFLMLSVVLLSMLMIILSILSVIRHLTCGNNLNWLLNLNLIYETQWFYWCENGWVCSWWKIIKMLGLTISSKFDWGSFIISIAKTASKKIGTLICSMQFLSMVALYLYKSTIRPHLRYCCQVWAGAPRCYLELLYKLQRRLCRTVGLSLATALEPLAHRWNVPSLTLFYRY